MSTASTVQWLLSPPIRFVSIKFLMFDNLTSNSNINSVVQLFVALITVRRRDNTSTPPPNNNTTTRYRIRSTTSTALLRLFCCGLRVSTAFGVVSYFDYCLRVHSDASVNITLTERRTSGSVL